MGQKWCWLETYMSNNLLQFLIFHGDVLFLHAEVRIIGRILVILRQEDKNGFMLQSLPLILVYISESVSFLISVNFLKGCIKAESKGEGRV